MAFTLGKKIKNNEIVVVLIPSAKYRAHQLDIAKYVSSKFKSICYVNVNEPFHTLHTNLQAKKIKCDHFLFIDVISKEKKPHDQCIYAGSPNSLTTLSITIKKVLESESFKILIFDSLSTLLTYNKTEVLTRFSHDLFDLIKKAKIPAVFFVQGDTDHNFLADITMFADTTINISRGA